jgi:hypothetical protein|tara:strand:- start:1319 stop:1606 length:288 start_codon:yes stop_codon:yes gene_type:complete
MESLLTMLDRITTSQLADLAMHIDQVDPIDWGMLSIKEEDAFRMMASQVLTMLKEVEPEQQLIVAAASLTKLTVENFVLNTQLYKNTTLSPHKHK